MFAPMAGADEGLQAIAAHSAVSTAHIRLHEPIVSVSPHVTHLPADHSHLNPPPPAPTQDLHTLVDPSPCMSRHHSSSLPQGLHQIIMPPPTLAPAQQAEPGMPRDQATTREPAQACGQQAKAQRQLFASMSARPSRLGCEAGGHTQAAEPLGTDPGTQVLGGAAAAYGRQLSLAEVYSRQRLFVCKMCRNPIRGLLCSPSSVQRIDYYQSNDMPLASFLAATTAPQKCPHAACGDGVAAHLRTFLHNRGRVTLSVSQLPAGKELPGADKGQVWFWARPLQVSAVIVSPWYAIAAVK